MECIFLNADDGMMFIRDDMENGHWIQQEMTVNADFPFVAEKQIEIGMKIAFRDPATDDIQVFEIRNVVNQEPDHYQQITAEHIAIAELSDEHIDSTEITDKTAQQALTTALTGTLWSVGTNTASGTQSADIGRGSVWNAITTIKNNWNVYITPRVVISSAGAITGRYLDISPAEGTFRGVRLSVRKNLIDPAVTYDDTEVYTALYGYGGQVTVTHSGSDDTRETLDFSSVTWSKTSSHPAKPSGQKYLEWADKTDLYGRNGRARFGYYQNNSITDATTLLEKTWEVLQKVAKPKISIAGTCVDLYRLGYKDQPLRLHDIAIVEIEETGEVFEKEIIMLDTDLVDPTGSRPEIGDYIPNIIYINRDTNDQATNGGGGGGGGGHGQTNLDEETSETYTEWIKTNNMIGMVVGTRQGNNYIKAGQIVLAINKSGETGSYESAAYINADHVNISATSTVHLLAGSIKYDANGNLILSESTGGGVYVEHNDGQTTATFGVWDKGNLTGGVMVTQINGQSAVKISGNVIDINGSQITINADRIDVTGLLNLISANAYAIDCGALGFTLGQGQSLTLTAGLSTQSLSVSGSSIAVGENSASWQTVDIPTLTFSTSHMFMYQAGGLEYSVSGSIITSHSTETIHYLGYTS